MLKRLHEAVASVCPIDGVSGVQGSIRIDFQPQATAPQKSAATTALNNFDWSPAAETAWKEAKNPDRKAIRDAAVAAIVDIDTYLAIASPTNAQVAAIVRKMAQQNRAIIKRLIQID